MKYKFAHNNINVLNLEKSLNFYSKALGLKEVKRLSFSDFAIVFLKDSSSQHQLELTYLKNRKEPYNLGDNEIHLAFTVDNFKASYEFHKKMNCIVFENQEMNLYFITDPDGYWIEIIPENKE